MGPAGFAVNYTRQHAVAIFVINFIAIIPLALFVGYVADELILRSGNVVGALINATFRSVVP